MPESDGQPRSEAAPANLEVSNLRPRWWVRIFAFLEKHYNKLNVVLSFLTAVVLFATLLLQNKSFLLQNRATLSVEQVSYSAEARQSPIARFKVFNRGKTVATHIVVNGDILLVPNAACGKAPTAATTDEADPVWTKLLKCTKKSSAPSKFPIAAIVPDASHSQIFEANDPSLNESQINDLINGTLRVYTYGTLTYGDFTQQTHKTTFCLFISGKGDGKDTGVATDATDTGWTPGLCPDGNDVE